MEVEPSLGGSSRSPAMVLHDQRLFVIGAEWVRHEFHSLRRNTNESPSGLTAFGSIMYSSFGFTTLEVLLVDIPRSVVSLIIFLCVAIYLRKVVNRRMYIMAAACVPPFVGLLALSLLPNTESYKWTKWGLYLMTVPYVLSLFLSWTLSMYLPPAIPNLLPLTETHQSNPT